MMVCRFLFLTKCWQIEKIPLSCMSLAVGKGGLQIILCRLPGAHETLDHYAHIDSHSGLKKSQIEICPKFGNT